LLVSGPDPALGQRGKRAPANKTAGAARAPGTTAAATPVRGRVPARAGPARATSFRRAAEPRAKNRGALATLEGLRRGQRFTLLDPSTGEVDAQAQVIATWVDRYSQVPFAEVKFHSGHVARYAAERLKLSGKGFAFQRRYIAEQRARLFRAIEAELGEKVEGVRLYSLDGPHAAPLARAGRARGRARGKEPYLGPFLRALGEPLGPGEALLGFQRGNIAVVSRAYAAFDFVTPIHEVLHAMTPDFVDQMEDRKLVNLKEGITEYFTYRVAGRQFGVRQSPDDFNAMHTRFAEQIANKIGERELRRIFFGKEPGLVDRLAKKVDEAVGRKGAFMRAARKLERWEPASLE
jgi:hypothetical protein